MEARLVQFINNIDFKGNVYLTSWLWRAWENNWPAVQRFRGSLKCVSAEYKERGSLLTVEKGLQMGLEGEVQGKFALGIRKRTTI